MEYRALGQTGFRVSALSFGASALGGVFGPVDVASCVQAVHAAFEAGINLFDVAPAYGAGRSEAVLGAALRALPRDRYFLSTKVGKYPDPEGGPDRLDYSRGRILASLAESAARLGTDYFDLVLLHDIEYEGRRHTAWALGEGLDTLRELKRAGRIGALGFGMYPMDLWRRVLAECSPDVGLVHNHYCLYDTGLCDLLPAAEAHRVGLINGAPFGSGLLTDQGPADWHPASQTERAIFRQAADFCRQQGSSISKLALQFASRLAGVSTTLFSAAHPKVVAQNIGWYEQPFDASLAERVREVLGPVLDHQWSY